MRTMFFGTAVLAVTLSGVVRADDQADARAILEESIKAHGGEPALGKFTGMYFKVKGTGYEGDRKTPFSFEWYFQGNDKMRTVTFNEENKVAEVEVVNGKEGWVKDSNEPTENLSNEQLQSRQELIYLNSATMLVPLKGEGLRLSPLDEIEVTGRKAIGILVKHDKHDSVKLFFEKETHLLVKLEHRYKNVDYGKEVDEESVYSDYRNVQETKQPFKVETSWDGEKISDAQPTEMKLYDKPLDEKLFTKP